MGPFDADVVSYTAVLLYFYSLRDTPAFRPSDQKSLYWPLALWWEERWAGGSHQQPAQPFAAEHETAFVSSSTSSKLTIPLSMVARRERTRPEGGRVFWKEWEEAMKPGWNFPEVSWALASRCSPVKARWLHSSCWLPDRSCAPLD